MRESVQKLNFFSSAFVSILGISLSAEILSEDDFIDKIDDLLLLVLAGFIIFWYRKKGKTAGPFPSLIFITLSLVIKAGAVIIESADKAAVGDDIGIIFVLLTALVFVIWEVVKIGRRKEA